MFLDETRIFVKGGRGGDGCVAFRREKYVPRGGPDGGDGGDGGSIILIADTRLATLADIASKVHYKAKNGRPGTGSLKHGKNGPDIVIKVPAGTIIRREGSDEIFAELLEDGREIVAAKGGKGGRGNKHFATPTNQTPHHYEDGTDGEEFWLNLELKLIADIGLVGLPNAGKSTFLSRVSDATPKIASYPFTTLIPSLGVVKMNDYRRMVVADLPGLIEGAHEGTGLGDEFLRHVERTRVLIHLIDIQPLDDIEPEKAYEMIRQELEKYSMELAGKPEIVALNKTDLLPDEEMKKVAGEMPGKAFLISAVAGKGVKELLEAAWRIVADVRKKDQT